MNEDAKKTALRMIPYGLFVLTSKSKDGSEVGAATVNWVTQASFTPPLVVVGVKADSGAHQHIKETGVFAINVLGKDQLDIASRSSNRRSATAIRSTASRSKMAPSPARRY